MLRSYLTENAYVLNVQFDNDTDEVADVKISGNNLVKSANAAGEVVYEVMQCQFKVGDK